jgi:hypothetical protein
MPYLTGVSITVITHDESKDADKVVHVLVKNRLSTTEGFDQDNDFLSNLLAAQRYFDTGDLGGRAGSPCLAFGIGLTVNQEFEDPSAHNLTLMPDLVGLDEIVLPVVHVHTPSNSHDRLIFDYEVTFNFDDNTSSTFSSKPAGLPGVILISSTETIQISALNCGRFPRLPGR